MISGVHQTEEAGLVLRRAVTDIALGRQAGEAGPPEHPWAVTAPPPPPDLLTLCPSNSTTQLRLL